MLSQFIFWIETYLGAIGTWDSVRAVMSFLFYKGIHARSAERANVALKYPYRSGFARHEVDIASLVVINTAIQHEQCIKIDSHQLVHKWIVKRVDVIVMNHTMILATILSCIITFLLPSSLFNWSLQPNANGFYRLVLAITSSIIIILGILIRIYRRQIETVVAGMFEYDSEKYSSIIKRTRILI